MEGPKIDAATAEILAINHKEVQIKVPGDTLKESTDKTGVGNNKRYSQLRNVMITVILVAKVKHKRVDEPKRKPRVVKGGSEEGGG